MAAENGWNEAKVRLSYEYHFGHNGIKKDTQKAIYWYQKVTDRKSISNRSSLFLFGNNDLKINFGRKEELLKKSTSFRIHYRISPSRIKSSTGDKRNKLFF